MDETSEPEVQNLVNEAMSAGDKFKEENQQLIDSYGVDELNDEAAELAK